MLKRTRTVLIIITAVFVGLYGIVWLASPPVARLVLNKVLESEKVVLSDTSHVRLNLFVSRLTLEDFELIRRDETTLHIQQMQVRYSLFKLFSREVHIKKLMLDGLKVVINSDGDDAHAAGFLLNRPAPDEPANEPNEEATPGRKVAIAVPEIALKNLEIVITKGSQQHLLKFNTIDIARTLYEDAVLNSNVAVTGSLDGASFNIKSKINYGVDSANANIDFAIDAIPLDKYHYLLPESIAELAGSVSLDIKADLEREGEALSVSNIAANLTLSDLSYSDNAYQASLNRLEVGLQNGLVGYPGDTAIEFDGKLQFNGSTIEAALAGAKDKLAGIEKLSLRDLAVSLRDNQPEINIASLVLDNVWFSQPDDKTLPKIVHFNQLTVDNVSANTSQASIERLAIAGGEAAIIRNADGTIINLVATAPADTAATSESEDVAVDSNDSTENTQFQFALQTFEIADPLKIVVQDTSVRPRFDETFYLAKAELTDISNQSPDNVISYDFALNDGDFFKLNLVGTVAPFGEKLNGDFKLQTREFALPDVSPYVSNALGFNISAGQMDLDFNGTIQQDQLNSVADSHLRGAEFKSDKNYEEKDMLGQTAIPLNVALGMLKDGDGNIDLKMPVNGDIRSPDFSVHHIIGMVVRKAAMSQAKSYLIKTFIPYGQVLSVAMAAGSYALKVRFEDLPYQATQLEPSEAQTVFANQLATLMQDKPDLQIKVCPVVTSADLEQTAGKTTLNDDEKNLLIDFGEQRSGAFKRYMVDSKGVNSARLLLCTPEIEMNAPAQPRIKFSI